MTAVRVTFSSGGSSCVGWHHRAVSDRFAGPAGRPVVVMAHGLGGTVDSGLDAFAGRFSAAGIDVFAFDYRGFGESEGELRQSVSVKRQIADYHAACLAAGRLPGTDPGRLVLWGVSLGGGHVLRVAAERSDVAAVIALTPLTSGPAAARSAITHYDMGQILLATLTGIASRIATVVGRRPILMPLVAQPHQRGALTIDGAYGDYLALAGPTWRNEIDTAIGIELGGIRTTAAARNVRCPTLVQIADFDRYAPPNAAAKAAVEARAVVRHYPCDHFEVWSGRHWFDKAADDQLAFLTAVFADT